MRPSRHRLVVFRAVLLFAALLPAMWGTSNAVLALQRGPHVVHELIGAGVVLCAVRSW